MQTAQKTDPFEPPCVLYDLPFSDYLQIPAASSHALGTLLAKSPLHAKTAQDKPSEAKSLGTLVHAMLLTPSIWRDEVLIKPAVNRATNAGKAELVDWMLGIVGDPGHEAVAPFVAAKMADGKRYDAMLGALEPLLAATGKDMVSADKVPIAEQMVENVLAKDIGRVIFESGKPETTMMAVDPVSGVLVKTRPDWLPDGHEVIVDLKTCRSAAWDDFKRDARNYGYDLQASLYRRVYSEVKASKAPSFIFCAVENAEPYGVSIFEVTEQFFIDLKSENKLDVSLDRWKICEESGFWPDYGYDFESKEYVIQKL